MSPLWFLLIVPLSAMLGFAIGALLCANREDD